jgi:hypothetical protein
MTRPEELHFSGPDFENIKQRRVIYVIVGDVLTYVLTRDREVSISSPIYV